METDTPAIFVSTSTGASLSRPIGMGDFLEGVSVEDLAESLRAEPELAAALLVAREAKQRV